MTIEHYIMGLGIAGFGFVVGFIIALWCRRPKASYKGQVIMQGLVGSPLKDSNGKVLSPAPHFSMTMKNKLDGAAMIRLEGDNVAREVLRGGSVGYIWRMEFHLVGKKTIGSMFAGDKVDGQVTMNPHAFGGSPGQNKSPFM